MPLRQLLHLLVGESHEHQCSYSAKGNAAPFPGRSLKMSRSSRVFDRLLHDVTTIIGLGAVLHNQDNGSPADR